MYAESFDHFQLKRGKPDALQPSPISHSRYTALALDSGITHTGDKECKFVSRTSLMSSYEAV
jgi:hypothetical protein